ncbi:hypothetical protein N0V83_001655 [Neocucurbitaria cava]|uniref:N-acetyltransferase domain-containing protein n=1 Tax=Neocucurbitaria cava TaxID=798079 RepID=A0A9W9CQL4_9PLEO|nr:hypothetical protein N0V83_001655 [Neocucurbitaria cava]
MDKKVFQWQRTINSQRFLISSDRALLPHSFVQEVFASEAVFWAKPVASDEALRTMLSTSFTMGLYLLSPDDTRTPIGMARMVTDFTTIAFLTDVYVQDAYRALGLGKWMIHCCREWALDIPELRWLMLNTGSEQAQNLYRREFGMILLDGKESAPITCMGARKEKLAEVAAASGAILQDEPSAPNAQG